MQSSIVVIISTVWLQEAAPVLVLQSVVVFQRPAALFYETAFLASH